MGDDWTRGLTKEGIWQAKYGGMRFIDGGPPAGEAEFTEKTRGYEWDTSSSEEGLTGTTTDDTPWGLTGSVTDDRSWLEGLLWDAADTLGFHKGGFFYNLFNGTSQIGQSTYNTVSKLYIGAKRNVQAFDNQYQISNNIQNFNNQYQVTTRALGALQAVGGVLEGITGAGVTAVGLGTSEFGVGVPITIGGGVILAHGADQTATGLRTFWNGSPNDTLTSQGLQAAGMSPTAANLTDAGLSIAFTAGGSAAINGRRASVLLPEGAVYNLDAPVIHGNSKLSPKTAYLYELYQTDGTFLKYGISQNPATRYSKSFMVDKSIEPIASGSRADMLILERQMVTQNPGPLNFEPWAGKAPGGN